MYRRDSQDKEWQKVKEVVRKRDRLDRLQKVLTPAEYSLVRRNAGPLIHTLDPAHSLPASKYPELIYKSYNIVLLNRWSHSQLDACRDPITGENISSEERDAWWIRILKGDTEQYEYLRYKGLIK